jgi:predicted TIM-barrel fold metal-dependent hydrolase
MQLLCFVKAFFALTVPIATCAATTLSPTPAIDHHQHLFRSGLPGAPEGSGPFGAEQLIEKLDEAGIERAVILSVAYQLGNPNRPAVEDEYDQVRAENDWTRQQVALHPDRLIGFCSFNPLKDYALSELRRCFADRYMNKGIKLHFGNSDVQLTDANHIARLRAVFAAANRRRMAIVLHLRPSVNMRRPYGAQEAQAFLDKVLPAAPRVTIQIAHLAGGGSFDDPGLEGALEVFATAVAAGDRRMKNVYFDISGVPGAGAWEAKADRIASLIRRLGISRMLSGADGAVQGNTPREAWQTFRKLPLTPEEFQAIASNRAPYLRQSD